MKKDFRANGKLLLNSEYFILDGAIGLCLPTKLGQTLYVAQADSMNNTWTSYNNNHEIWFHCTFDKQLNEIESSDKTISNRLMQILKWATKLNPQLLIESTEFKTYLEFPNNWGLGSSSTLISLIAQYFNCNPYALLQDSFGGSGYDIACATAQQPILFQRKKEQILVEASNFNPQFKEQLYFVHLNQKQNSRAGIAHYKSIAPEMILPHIDTLNSVTQQFLAVSDINEFCKLIDEHEALIASVLQLQKVKDTLFPDFQGSIKSLGAWGGDFVMAASTMNEQDIKTYFRLKGFFTIISYTELIK